MWIVNSLFRHSSATTYIGIKYAYSHSKFVMLKIVIYLGNRKGPDIWFSAWGRGRWKKHGQSHAHIQKVQSCWQSSRSAGDLGDQEGSIDSKWVGMNTSRMVCIWNHNSEGIKRNKRSGHLVEAYLHTICFFPGTSLLCFFLPDTQIA